MACCHLPMGITREDGVPLQCSQGIAVFGCFMTSLHVLRMNLDLLVRDSVGSEESIPVWGGPCTAPMPGGFQCQWVHQGTHTLGVAMTVVDR